MSNDTLMACLLSAKAKGETIFYYGSGDDSDGIVKDDHAWDLSRLIYKIKVRREFIINVRSDGTQPEIVETHNEWTRSDFGKYNGNDEYILMREVYPEEMK